MCEAVGLQVTGLKRVRVGELRLGKLGEGEWRFVKASEFHHRNPKPTRAKGRAVKNAGIRNQAHKYGHSKRTRS